MALSVQFTIARARRIGTYSPREVRAIIRTAQQDRHTVLVHQERQRATVVRVAERVPPAPGYRTRKERRQ